MKYGRKIIVLVIVMLCAFSAGVILTICNINKDKVEIPKVYFEGNISNMESKSDKRNIKIKYKSEDKTFESYAEIKVQGTSSLLYEKKNYNITLYQDELHENKNKVVMNEAWGEQSKYCLKANWIDKTHARNIITARIAATIQDRYGVFEDTPHNGTIDGFPVEIYINDEFLGIYTWNIPKDEWLWNMDDENPNHIVVGAGDNSLTTAFKEEFEEFSSDGWEVEVGSEDEATVEKLNRLIRFVKDSSDEEFKEDYEQYIDKDSMLNYICVYALTDAVDNIRKNLMLVTYDGKVWAPSLYDLDTTFGTNCEGLLLENYDDLEVALNSSMLFKRTIEAFPEEVADRYFELRKDIFTKEYIMNEFETFDAQIPESSKEKELKKWIELAGEDITQISEFLDYRIPFIDNYMYELYEIEE